MSTAAFHEAQRRLNLVKANAHTILGVKREQVHRVVESLSNPGTYVITTHRDGRVTHHEWRVPPKEEIDQAVTHPAPAPAPETKPEPKIVVPEPVPAPDYGPVPEPVLVEPVVSPVDTPEVFSEDISATSPETVESSVISEPEEPRLAEGLNETPPAPESPAAAKPAPRKRGRPPRKKA